jgi:hypothetical protein
MKSSKLLLALGVLGIGMLLASASASATVINQTTHTLLFDDGGFESQPDGQTSHIAYRDDRGGLDAASPVHGSVGTWSLTDPLFDSIQVTDYVSSPFPGAAEGTKYLRIVRTNGGAEPRATMNFAAQATAGDQIHWEGMIYTPVDTNTPIQILGNDGALFNVLTNYSDNPGAIASYVGVWPPATSSSVTYSAAKWQKWAIDYTIGASSLTLSVDGNSDTLATIGSGSLSSISFISSAFGTGCYIDAVPTPEPGTLTILAMGLVGMLAYAWKKRR